MNKRTLHATAIKKLSELSEQDAWKVLSYITRKEMGELLQFSRIEPREKENERMP